MNDIAEVAGASKPMIYAYLDSKDDLFIALRAEPVPGVVSGKQCYCNATHSRVVTVAVLRHHDRVDLDVRRGGQGVVALLRSAHP